MLFFCVALILLELIATMLLFGYDDGGGDDAGSLLHCVHCSLL